MGLLLQYFVTCLVWTMPKKRRFKHRKQESERRRQVKQEKEQVKVN